MKYDKIRINWYYSKISRYYKNKAAKSLDAYKTAVTKELKKSGKLVLVGFGTFSVVKRKARKGRNPQNGKEIKIPAKKVVKFKAGAELAKIVK